MYKDKKAEKYRDVPTVNFFSPVAMETLGAIEPKSLALLKKLDTALPLKPVSWSYLNTFSKGYL